ncbi:hypothetical protein GUITHDRAFT_148513 [Guillardia theta CCMP2712]|uniref:CCHC-type domain-containing protein n=1 Tax=Guillardia theta (strain CCMP2712) TaxID=905079 RepID=L1I9R3_GUITC|nr:hypothetical protein GUITHDRAFT_148513 [Guillardia theta CCMP2712]EKX32595.1 hypothetical protein GUITHDRAFT_148513 [Guillardia theta CCMP2712]|eukprot:XP_005819575.1 hypothetical protein GUITHDRAFT_148513 [Guillardia theta CCMP2712]
MAASVSGVDEGERRDVQLSDKETREVDHTKLSDSSRDLKRMKEISGSLQVEDPATSQEQSLEHGGIPQREPEIACMAPAAAECNMEVQGQEEECQRTGENATEQTQELISCQEMESSIGSNQSSRANATSQENILPAEEILDRNGNVHCDVPEDNFDRNRCMNGECLADERDSEGTETWTGTGMEQEGNVLGSKIIREEAEAAIDAERNDIDKQSERNEGTADSASAGELQLHIKNQEVESQAENLVGSETKKNDDDTCCEGEKTDICERESIIGLPSDHRSDQPRMEVEQAAEAVSETQNIPVVSLHQVQQQDSDGLRRQSVTIATKEDIVDCTRDKSTAVTDEATKNSPAHDLVHGDIEPGAEHRQLMPTLEEEETSRLDGRTSVDGGTGLKLGKGVRMCGVCGEAHHWKKKCGGGHKEGDLSNESGEVGEGSGGKAVEKGVRRWRRVCDLCGEGHHWKKKCWETARESKGRDEERGVREEGQTAQAAQDEAASEVASDSVQLVPSWEGDGGTARAGMKRKEREDTGEQAAVGEASRQATSQGSGGKAVEKGVRRWRRVCDLCGEAHHWKKKCWETARESKGRDNEEQAAGGEASRQATSQGSGGKAVEKGVRRWRRVCDLCGEGHHWKKKCWETARESKGRDNEEQAAGGEASRQATSQGSGGKAVEKGVRRWRRVCDLCGEAHHWKKKCWETARESKGRDEERSVREEGQTAQAAQDEAASEVASDFGQLVPSWEGDGGTARAGMKRKEREDTGEQAAVGEASRQATSQGSGGKAAAQDEAASDVGADFGQLVPSWEGDGGTARAGMKRKEREDTGEQAAGGEASRQATSQGSGGKAVEKGVRRWRRVCDLCGEGHHWKKKCWETARELGRGHQGEGRGKETEVEVGMRTARTTPALALRNPSSMSQDLVHFKIQPTNSENRSQVGNLYWKHVGQSSSMHEPMVGKDYVCLCDMCGNFHDWRQKCNQAKTFSSNAANSQQMLFGQDDDSESMPRSQEAEEIEHQQAAHGNMELVNAASSSNSTSRGAEIDLPVAPNAKKGRSKYVWKLCEFCGERHHALKNCSGQSRLIKEAGRRRKLCGEIHHHRKKCLGVRNPVRQPSTESQVTNNRPEVEETSDPPVPDQKSNVLRIIGEIREEARIATAEIERQAKLHKEQIRADSIRLINQLRQSIGQ